MLAPQRQAAILELLRHRREVRVSHLVRRFGVSAVTIRRDLDRLARAGLVRRLHGAAQLAAARVTDEPGFGVTALQQEAEKRGIAARAARLVAPGSAVALSAGSTTVALAAALLGVPALTLVTNSLPAARLLHAAGRADQTVVLTGGVRTVSEALTGPVADAAIGAFDVDVFFLGVHGMSVRSGYTTPNLYEARTNRLLVRAARRLVVLADHTKWGRVGIATIAPLDAADLVITDVGLPREACRRLRRHAAELAVVEPVPGAFAAPAGG